MALTVRGKPVFANYRQALSAPGALLFSLTGLVARLPISMVSLGIVLLVSARTGSYGYAGGVSAACVVATAVASPGQGRLADARGQQLMLMVVPTTFVTGTALLVWSVESGWPTPVPHVFAALTGASLPQIGSLVRARWTYLLDERRLINTAFAFEAVVDEMIFISGPVLVTFLATLIDPVAGLACAGVAAFCGGLALATQTRTQPPASRGAHGTSRQPIGWARLTPLCVAAAGSGAMFGAAEVVVVAFATEHGDRSASGVLLAIWAFASLISGIIVGALGPGGGPLRRFRVASLCLTTAMIPLVFVPSVLLAGVTLFVAGFAISPTMVSQMALVEELVPRERLTEGMSWFTMGMAAGVGLGGALSGQVIDEYDASLAFLVPIAAAGVAAAVAWTVPRPDEQTTQAAARRAHLD